MTTPLEEAVAKVTAAVRGGNGLREILEADQHPEGTTDDSPSVAWILNAADGTTMIVEWGWHEAGGAWVRVQKFDTASGGRLEVRGDWTSAVEAR